MPSDRRSKKSGSPSQRVFPRLVTNPLRAFLQTEAAGGVALFAATVVALLVANSPLGNEFEGFWRTEVGDPAGGLDLPGDIRHWINDALMTLFFLVVGLEIKRELVAGELSDRSKAALPALAALGGMVGPALLYVALNAGGAGSSGWGIPMATDIAFVVGALALLGTRAPSGLKIFLLSLAIVDDIGAIVVIGLFYSGGLEPLWLLAAAAGLVVVVLVFRSERVRSTPAYIVLGALIWLATYQSGIHATIAGVALALSTPLAAAERMGQRLHPWTSFLIVPVFALANAGVALGFGRLADATTSAITVGVVLGLVVGKMVGISGAVWLALKTKIGLLPEGVTSRHLVGGSAVAGIGFTVSLFITGLAFDDPELISAAKIGVLVGSLLAGAIGVLLLRLAPETTEAEEE